MNNVLKHPVLRGTALTIVAAATLYGCKDFLTSASTPQGTLTENSLLNRGGVEGTLIAAYRALDWNNGVGGNWGSTASNWVWGSVTSDDAYKGSEASDQSPINDVEAYHWNTANVEGYLNEKWRGVYEGVVRTNATIRLLNRVVTANPDEITPAVAAGIEGEAKFLRAHFHFEAWRMWGNIPYYREADSTDFRKANIPSAQVATEIIADLDAAIALLPTTPRNGQVGRATSWAAKAYKGRVQVYARQFAAALTTLRDVQANGPYDLETSFDRVWTGYADADNGPETILAYQASSNDGEPDGNNANYGERLNFPHSGSHFGCCGFHQPSQNLVNFYQVDNATGLPLALTNATWNARDVNTTSAVTTPFDPRLDWTVGRDGVPYKDWGAHQPGWIRAPAYGGPYSPKKNIHERLSGAEQLAGGWAPAQQNSVNIHIFRYADMLLLLAEAEVEAGSTVNAMNIVNEIRTRAGQRAQGPGTDRANTAVPIDDPSITWADYRIGLYPTNLNQADARTAVRYERRLELAMEGQRFFDLRRWGVDDQNVFLNTINGYVNGIAGGAEESDARRPYLKAAEPVAAKHLLFPIPAIQIQLSRVGEQPMLTQNPGW
jgi:hypothetical protein